MVPAANRYREIQQQTASKERLMVLLLEAALKHLRAGADALEAGRVKEAHLPLTRANDIVVELHSTLDRSQAPELCDRLAEVYRFVSFRALRAITGRDPVPAREALKALEPIAEGFAGAVAALEKAEEAR
jgi:flagellar secretion chaperone FliS